MQHQQPQPLPINTPRQLVNFGFREIQCAWNYCYRMGWMHPTLINTISLEQKMNHLVIYLNSLSNKDYFIDQIIYYQTNNLIDNNYFNWINKKDKRLIIHLINALINEFRIQINIGFLPNLYEEFVINFDSIPYDINTKISFITNQKNIWSQIKTKDSQLKWLEQNNTVQLNWAWDYLGKFNKRNNAFFIPTENDDLLFSIQAAFDYMSYGNPSDKILFLERMKKTWSQKKFRDSGKAKKPYHLPLTKTTQKQLEQLAELKNCRKEQVIEKLIKIEFELLNLDENGKPKYK